MQVRRFIHRLAESVSASVQLASPFGPPPRSDRRYARR